MQSADSRFIASGHENGSVYIFSTDTGRMPFSLSGMLFYSQYSIPIFHSGLEHSLTFSRPGKTRANGCILSCWQTPRCCRRFQSHCVIWYFIWRTSRKPARAFIMDLVTCVEQHRRISVEWVSYMTLYLAVMQLDWWYQNRSFDGKVKVWSMDTKACVATQSETEKPVWSVKWLPKIGKSEGFATAGANRSIAFYREATGG